MKLAPRTFKIEWDLHAWFGVVASVGLFVVFYCGIFALFNADLALWQDPALYDRTASREEAQLSFDSLLAKVSEDTPIPRGARVALRQPPGRRVATSSVEHEESGLSRDITIDRVTGMRRAEPSRLADELYALHFFYQLPHGLELAGLMAIALFIATLSGIVIHWKDLARQLWQFRPQLRLRFSASDAHKVLGVFGIPFSLMFAWSGALLGLFTYLSVPTVYGMFGGDQVAFQSAAGEGQELKREASGQEQPQLPLERLAQLGAAAANQRYRPERPLVPAWIYLNLYGDANAWLTVRFPREGFEPYRSVDLSAVTGEVLHLPAQEQAPGLSFGMVLYDLHYAVFGGYLVKILYTLLALAVCAVVVTGNLVWIERRDAKRKLRGNRMLERVTVGGCFGLVLASSVYFALNRLLPEAIEKRADLELRIFFASWLVALLGTFVARWTARRIAAVYCTLSALSLGIVLLSDLVAQRIQLPEPGTAHVLAAQLLIAFLALCTALLGRKLSR